MIVVGKGLLTGWQWTQNTCEFLNEDLICVLLLFFQSFDSLIVRCIEQEVRGNTIGEEPQQEGQAELGEGYGQYDWVGDELKQIDDDPAPCSSF